MPLMVMAAVVLKMKDVDMEPRLRAQGNILWTVTFPVKTVMGLRSMYGPEFQQTTPFLNAQPTSIATVSRSSIGPGDRYPRVTKRR